MKLLSSLLLLFGLSIVLWGCPYKSDVGIDDTASIKIDKALLGTWHKTYYPSDSTELSFTKSTAQKYALNVTISDGESGYDSHHYTAWFSKVDKWQLMTLYDTEEKKFSFGEVELKNNQLSVKLLSEDITADHFTTTADMKKFIESIYKEKKVLYDSDVDLTELVKDK